MVFALATTAFAAEAVPSTSTNSSIEGADKTTYVTITDDMIKQSMIEKVKVFEVTSQVQQRIPADSLQPNSTDSVVLIITRLTGWFSGGNLYYEVSVTSDNWFECWFWSLYGTASIYENGLLDDVQIYDVGSSIGAPFLIADKSFIGPWPIGSQWIINARGGTLENLGTSSHNLTVVLTRES